MADIIADNAARSIEEANRLVAVVAGDYLEKISFPLRLCRKIVEVPEINP